MGFPSLPGQPPVSPSLHVFAPSEQQIKSEKKAILVCHVSGFSPAAFNLKWKVDGAEITSGVETTKATKQGGKYLASSYLTRSDSDYADRTFVCEVVHNGKTFSKCASLWYVFGGGTDLTVTGQPTVSPTVNAYASSEEDIRTQNKATLVCLINGFYPSTFNLKWKGGRQDITSGVETTKATKQGDKYVASSYLTLSTSEYQNHDIYTCEVTHGEKTFVKTVQKPGNYWHNNANVKI
ncbi:Immunoglobulin lambda-like polypeptide 5, partial [Ophiophagus hannah]